jgi:hypothetical protein
MLLVDTRPELATELERLLIKAQQSELAAQVSKLTILDRCAVAMTSARLSTRSQSPRGATALAFVLSTWMHRTEC